MARLQREVAQSKSEGAMVSCSNSLLCNSCLTASGLPLGIFCLAEDGHQSFKAVLDLMMGSQCCVHKSEETQGFIWAALEKLW